MSPILWRYFYRTLYSAHTHTSSLTHCWSQFCVIMKKAGFTLSEQKSLSDSGSFFYTSCHTDLSRWLAIIRYRVFIQPVTKRAIYKDDETQMKGNSQRARTLGRKKSKSICYIEFGWNVCVCACPLPADDLIPIDFIFFRWPNHFFCSNFE